MYFAVQRGKRRPLVHWLTKNQRSPCTARYTLADALPDIPAGAGQCATCLFWVTRVLPKIEDAARTNRMADEWNVEIRRGRE